MKTYLVCHTNPDGTGVAQTERRAKSLDNLHKWFHRTYGDRRVVTEVGVKGCGS